MSRRKQSRETPDACDDCGGVYVHSEDCERGALDDTDDDDHEPLADTCPDCGEGCEPWTQDRKPCGLEADEAATDPEIDTSSLFTVNRRAARCS